MRAVTTRDRPPRTLYTRSLIRATLFSDRTDESDVAWCAERLRDPVSFRAVLDMMLLDAPQRRTLNTPLLVLGAAEDGLVSTRQVHATARAYRTSAEFFTDMGHDMMLESDWPAVAHRIQEWLTEHGF